MRITKAICWKEDLELSRPYTIAYRTISAVENLFIRLETENGIIGLGAGSPGEWVTGERIEDSLAGLQAHLEELLLGKDLRHFRSIIRESRNKLRGLPAAQAAVDIALYDAFAQSVGVPLVKLLGQCHQSLPTSITIGIKSVEATLAEAEEHMANGFKIIKLKTGSDVEADVEIFSRLRAKVGPDIKIRVDANQGYQPKDFNNFVKAARHLDIEFIEQPVPNHKLELMMQIPAKYRENCAADEDLHDARDAVRLARPSRPFGIYNIKLMKCGGIHEALRIASIAEAANIALMWGCMDESIISITAALHAALACPNTHYLDLDGSLDLARDIVSGGFILEDGCLRVDERRAGLGVKSGDLTRL
jgi:L-alanine-DL-glutamate epimerase-like enolase superfamily enzyme